MTGSFSLVQVHPVVSRLCDPIEGTDSARLADCLGLDPMRFRSHVNARSDDVLDNAALACAPSLDDDELYKVRKAIYSSVMLI